jgi:hypothetical protein
VAVAHELSTYLIATCSIVLVGGPPSKTMLRGGRRRTLSGDLRQPRAASDSDVLAPEATKRAAPGRVNPMVYLRKRGRAAFSMEERSSTGADTGFCEGWIVDPGRGSLDASTGEITWARVQRTRPGKLQVYGPRNRPVPTSRTSTSTASPQMPTYTTTASASTRLDD